MGIIVENPGLLTTVQDEGRFGWEQFGVSPSGPMDAESFHIANILAGNDAGESALECTLAGPALRFTEDETVAVTGADMSPLLNGAPCPMNRALAIRAGDVLKLQPAKNGCRAYIAFAGGLDVPLVMGSRATGIQNKIGGLNGRRLAKGDEINFRAPSASLENMPARVSGHALRTGRENVLRVIMGPQDDRFTDEGLRTFLGEPYKVTNDCDRMGCRLEGPAIQHKTDGNIISDGIATGAIQVPTSGQPIIMMAERQTVGGYTKIAAVISADLPVIAQCRPGDVVRFRAVSLAEAHRLRREGRKKLEDLAARIKGRAAGPARRYCVTVGGRRYEVSVEEIR